MFLSYVSPQAVQSTVNYAEKLGVHRFFFWTYSGDIDYDQPNSLIHAVNLAAPDAQVGGYWADWEIYNSGNAIPTPPYSIDSNKDLTNKLTHSNEVIYAFLEAQVAQYQNTFFHQTVDNKFHDAYGSLYLFDPGADLKGSDISTPGSFCTTPPLEMLKDHNGNNLVCTYVPQELDKDFTSFAQTADSFGHFTRLNTTTGKDGNPINTVISVGGFGHNDTFEGIFNPPSYISKEKAMTNFVHSAKAIMDAYGIHGIDLDYENVAMTPQQSQDYLTLIQMVNGALASDPKKYITLAILSNPEYIAGTESNGAIGFAPHVLEKIAALPKVKAIDLMTYDFHGYWDFNATHTTGFLSNLFAPVSAPTNQLFSIKTSIAALHHYVGYDKIGVGIPTYARGFANVSSGADATGLFSPLTPETIVPGGDLDPKDCTSAIANNPSCNGMFSYKYIVNKMLPNGFKATDWKNGEDDASTVNGTTAFANHWVIPTPPNHQLTIDNHSAAGMQLFVGSFNTNAWLNNTTMTYDNNSNPSVATIQDATDLTIKFISWFNQADGGGNCTLMSHDANIASFDFTKSTTIKIVNVNTQAKTATCEISQAE